MTGLSAKALRLYAERGIRTPASVDPASGYRFDDRAQLRHGITTDLLRRAQVPLAELASAADFDFEDWRGKVALRRSLEDFYLAVAEVVSAFDPDDHVAHTTEAPALPWVGAVVDLDVPDDIEARLESFTALAFDVPAVLNALDDGLADVGVAPAESFWTAVPESAARNGGHQMLVARPLPGSLDPPMHERLAARLRSALGQGLAVIGGTLPPRLELTFTGPDDEDPTPEREAAKTYLHLLAFEDHVRRHGLRPIGHGARQVGRRETFAVGGSTDNTVSVFDVHPPSSDRRPGNGRLMG